MDEAGRKTDPPEADGSYGNSAASAPGVPPLPADEVGRVKAGSPYALGYRSGLAASGDVSDTAKGGGTVVSDSAADEQVSASGAAGYAGPVNSAASDDTIIDGNPVIDGDAAIDRDAAIGGHAGMGSADVLPGTASALGGKLDSGRQAVRQAAAATTSWFANRAGTQTATRSGTEASALPETRPQPLPSAPAGTTPAGTDMAWQSPASPAGSSSPSSPSSPWSSSAAAAQSADAGLAGPGYGAVPRGNAGAGPSAARAAGYSSAATAGWQSRVTPAAGRRPAPDRRGPRQAHLTLARVEPWSVMKFSFVASVVAFIILFVAITVLYMALSGLGVFTSLQHTVSTITSSQGSSGTNISGWFSASRILGYTGMLGALNIVLITALSTIGSVVYNLIAHVFGGIEVTLRESD